MKLELAASNTQDKELAEELSLTLYNQRAKTSYFENLK